LEYNGLELFTSYNPRNKIQSCKFVLGKEVEEKTIGSMIRTRLTNMISSLTKMACTDA